VSAVPIRLGVLGCAGIAWRKMLPALAHEPGVVLTAVASRQADRAARFAERFGGEPVVGYEALLERSDVDAVYVPLPHGNGEQRLNASAQLASGAAIVIDDAELTPETVVSQVGPLAIDGIMRDGMTASAAAIAGQHADEMVARIVLAAAAAAQRKRKQTNRPAGD